MGGHRAFGDPFASLFEEGNHLYEAGEYEEAISKYELILEGGYENGTLYYNLGNAHYKLNHIAPAIFYYEKAARLMPREPDVKINLKLANLRVIDKITPRPRLVIWDWFDSFRGLFSLGLLTGLVLGLYLILIIGLIVYVWFRKVRLRRMILYGMGPTAFLLLLFLGLFLLRIHEIKKLREGIIFSPMVEVRSAPGEGETELFLLHEGVKAKIRNRVGDWVEIELADGKVGWVGCESLREI
ncbi:tetratricopeptide repeat protein [candidate division KSB1 bacterium]|nr:tetratricopeptide repeat protein [candidate division KSB1 bacterium]